MASVVIFLGAFGGAVFDTAWFVGGRFQEACNLTPQSLRSGLFDEVKFNDPALFSTVSFGGVVAFREAILQTGVAVMNGSVHTNVSADVARAYRPGFSEHPPKRNSNWAEIRDSPPPNPPSLPP